MRQYIYSVAYIACTVMALLSPSQEVRAQEQTGVSGLYRDGVLVDTFIEPIPTQSIQPEGYSVTDVEAPTRVRSSELRERVQAQPTGNETRDRNETFTSAADSAIRMQDHLEYMMSQQGSNGSEELEQLQVLLDALESTQIEAREALLQILDRVTELGLDESVRQRQLDTLTAFDEGIEALSSAIRDVIAGESGALPQAYSLMQQIKFRDEPQLLNAGAPFQRHVEQAPRLTREEADDASGAQSQSISSAGKSSAVVMSAKSLPGPDDLVETPDIQFTPAIAAKAAELGGSAQAIYEFMRNNVTFEPYLGSRKGAANTLKQLRGNDTDQASLLIALLRVSGIPSRYVRGTIEMAPEPAMKWLGVDDAATAASILTTAGLDGVAITNGPDVVAVQSTKVWVEAYVPYSNYRGGDNDDRGSTWVPLDPSFKAHDITPGEDVLTPMGFNVDTFINNFLSTVSEPDPLEQLELDIQAYLDANDPGKTVADIERIQEIASQLLGLLPATPPYPVLSISARFSELEASKRYKVRFHLYDGGTDFIDHTIDLHELAGRRLTIEYVGATSTDQATIDSFGGIYETPPSLVDVKPVLELDGVPIATSSNSIGMGYSHSSDMQFIEPAGASNVQPLVENEIIAGNGQAIGFDTFLDLHDSFFGAGLFPPEDFLEGILHVTATDYLSRVNRGLEKAGHLMGIVTTQDVSEAIVENSIAVTYSIGGDPLTFEWRGLTVDADRRIIGTFGVDGGNAQDIPFMKLTGVHGSLMENRIFEEMFEQDAVSTIKILQLASEAGIGICTIQTSIAVDCPGITQPPSVISAINSALSQGHIVTIPEDPITVSLWSGTGYMDIDPTTGAGGYIISGGISGVTQTDGGATVEAWPVALPCEATAVSGNVLIPPADSPDPGAMFCADNSSLQFKVEFTSTCEEGPPKTHQQNFTTSHTKAQLGGGHYTLQLAAFGSNSIIRKITIVEVEKVEADAGDEFDDMDGNPDTKTVVLKKDTAGLVTVTATPKPVLAEDKLPNCWTVNKDAGATDVGNGKLKWTVPKNTADANAIKVTSGASYKKTKVVVANVQFKEDVSQDYGFDDWTDPKCRAPVQLGCVPRKSLAETGFIFSDTDPVTADIKPPSDPDVVFFKSMAEGVVTVSPDQASAAMQTLTLEGKNTGSTRIEARAAKENGTKIAELEARVYEERSITVRVILVHEENDDEQAVDLGNGESDYTYITAGPDGTLDTSPAGDDDCNTPFCILASSIDTGADGVANTVPAGDDVAFILPGQGKPYGECVTSGSNAFRDTATPVLDDELSGDDIDSGVDGICQTVANDTDIISGAGASNAVLSQFMNSQVYDQAVIEWDISHQSSAVTANFDLNRDGQIDVTGAFMASLEMRALRDAAKDDSYDRNVFLVDNPNDGSGGFCGFLQRYCYVHVDIKNAAASCIDTQITAHELGHSLSMSHVCEFTGANACNANSDIKNLMHPACNSGSTKTKLRHGQWDVLNPGSL